MVMDRQRGYYGPINGIKFEEESILDQTLINGLKGGGTCMHQDFFDLPQFLPDPDASVIVPHSRVTPEGDSHEDYDFSDVVLSYINQILMEEDMEEKTCMFQESAALQAAEKSFYEALGENYPPFPDPKPFHYLDQTVESLEKCYSSITSSNCNTSSSSSAVGPAWNCDPGDYDSNNMHGVTMDLALRSTSLSSFSSLSSSGSVIDGLADSPVSSLGISDISVVLRKGFAEERSVLPCRNALCLDPVSFSMRVHETKNVVVKTEQKYDTGYSPDSSRGKKNPHADDLSLEEERSNKQSAVYTETIVRSEMFDMVLLCSGGKNDFALRKELQNGMKKSMQQNGQAKGSSGGNARGKKSGAKRNVVDLRTLLMLCAQAVSADDQRTANELLKQIRQHSSPTGDGMQRMAHYFADGLEARMAGSGAPVHMSLPTSAAEILKAYHLLLAACPFKKLSNFFSNKSIMKIAKKATRLHIVDFGILYGFQWPCLIQRLSSRPGGPPCLRITGIDFPIPGFRPAQRVEETGRRLLNYAETFGVPFQFSAIAQKWETIQIEDLKLNEDEVLVVNCQYRFRNLLDETVVVESPRNTVLNLIRKMNPDVFVQGVVNGAYNAPFFATRFREAVFHFSSLFDMLDTNVPRDVHERMLFEKHIFGWEAMNVIACEGAERIERPETYKQWQARNLRAGFRQLPLDPEIMTMAKDRVKTSYHKDFMIDEDGYWMLQGWKGRIIYAISSWKPV